MPTHNNKSTTDQLTKNKEKQPFLVIYKEYIYLI